MKESKLAFMPNQSELKALTWKQPFAELMLHGKIETRTWRKSVTSRKLRSFLGF